MLCGIKQVALDAWRIVRYAIVKGYRYERTVLEGYSVLHSTRQAALCRVFRAGVSCSQSSVGMEAGRLYSIVNKACRVVRATRQAGLSACDMASSECQKPIGRYTVLEQSRGLARAFSYTLYIL